MTNLDEKALEAAWSVYHGSTNDKRGALSDAIRVYLSTATPADVAGLVERLEHVADQLDHMTKMAGFGGAETGVRVKDTSALLAGLREAATALQTISAERDALSAICGEMERALNLVAYGGKFSCFDDEAWDVVNDALSRRAKVEAGHVE